MDINIKNPVIYLKSNIYKLYLCPIFPKIICFSLKSIYTINILLIITGLKPTPVNAHKFESSGFLIRFCYQFFRQQLNNNKI